MVRSTNVTPQPMNQSNEKDTTIDRMTWLRGRMVETQLRARGLTDERVMAAMESVPREEFVSPEDVGAAYADCALSIDYGQTISQPFTVAFMCEMTSPQPHERVLDVGTGSGYGAAVLSLLAEYVDSIECVTESAHVAGRRLQRLGFENVTVRIGDGSKGSPEHAPYDVIVVAAAAPELPQPLLDQLADGGRLIIPLGNAVFGQSLTLVTRRGEEFATKDLGEFSFVPLVSDRQV